MDARKPYLTDLTEAQWSQVSRFIPAPEPGGRPAQYDRREIINALLYVVRTGCQWRMLPHDLPPWKTVYWYFMTWRKDGTLDRLHDKLRGICGGPRASSGRPPSPSSTASRSRRPKGGGPHGYDSGKKVNGRKRHLLVNALGLILAVVVHPADIQDRDGAKLVLEAVRHRFSRPTAGGRGSGVPGPAAPVSGGADVRVAGPQSTVEQGLRGGHGERRGDGQVVDGPSHDPPTGPKIEFLDTLLRQSNGWGAFGGKDYAHD